MSIALHFGLTTQSKLHGRNYIEANEANVSYLNWWFFNTDFI